MTFLLYFFAELGSQGRFVLFQKLTAQYAPPPPPPHTHTFTPLISNLKQHLQINVGIYFCGLLPNKKNTVLIKL